MKISSLNLLKVILLSFIFIGCSTKVNVRNLEPSIINDIDIKTVSIAKFENDKYGLGSKISSQMHNVVFENKKYFDIVDRKNLDSILEEQKLEDSGITVSTEPNNFNLKSAKTLINGKIGNLDHKRHAYYKKRKYCSFKRYDSKGKYLGCGAYSYQHIACTQHVYNLNADITVTKVSTGEVLLEKNFDESDTYNICSSSNSKKPSKGTVFNKFTQTIATNFVNLITPTYKNTTVEVIEDEDIDYSSENELLLENGLIFLETNIKNAKIVFKKLVNNTKYKSTTALYNYGLTLELLGDFEEALIYYKKANELSIFQADPNELISKAVSRLEANIEKNKIALKQINKGSL